MGKSKAKPEIRQTGELLVPEPYLLAVGRHLSKVSEIDAVFVWTDENEVMHVYSVVEDYRSKVYDKLLRQERLIEKDLPKLPLEFHVRAHQGRNPERAVPFGSRPVFLR
jgi:hypothetical protein